MRDALCSSLFRHGLSPDFVFLTGDLGYKALEPLQSKMGQRFINAGVAEQNMVGVAAGLAREGLLPWIYSIGPFIYARAYEQIKNDVGMHNLPVVMVGNGGGYGYGVMGGTHHSLEDYALMSTIQKCRVYIPAFSWDVAAIVDELMQGGGPAYLRLGRCEAGSVSEKIPFQPWRQLCAGDGPVMVTTGPIAGGLQQKLQNLTPSIRPNLWVVALLPLSLNGIPETIQTDVRSGRKLIVVEEHIAEGGLATMLCRELALLNVPIKSFEHLHADRTLTVNYGSQSYCRRVCGIDPAEIAQKLEGRPLG